MVFVGLAGCARARGVVQSPNAARLPWYSPLPPLPGRVSMIADSPCLPRRSAIWSARLAVASSILVGALTVLLAAISFGALLVAGCSGSALGIQARTADMVARVANGARPLVVAEFARAQREVLDRLCLDREHCDVQAVRTELTAVRARWAPVWIAADATAGLHATWAAQIQRCGQRQDRSSCTPEVLDVARQFVDRVQEFRCALRAVGRHELDVIPLPLLTCGEDGGT